MSDRLSGSAAATMMRVRIESTKSCLVVPSSSHVVMSSLIRHRAGSTSSGTVGHTHKLQLTVLGRILSTLREGMKKFMARIFALPIL